MNGIEKITQRIDADTQTDIDRILAEARENAAQITARYQAQADKESALCKTRNEKAAAEREERLISVAQMEARKVTLATKQGLVEQAFNLALQKLCALPDATYIETAAKLMVQAAPDGRGSAVFSAKDCHRVGKATVEVANKLLGTNGKLTLSDETRTIQGGFILVKGNVEVNCTFETLVRLQRGTMSGETAKVLFDQV